VQKRNSAQVLAETCNLNVKEKIQQYQALGEGSVTSDVTPCSIVVTEPTTTTTVTSSRLSIASNASSVGEEVNDTIEYGTSVFYVNWD